MRKYYGLTKELSNKIKTIAGDIYTKKDDLIDKEITWEYFTTSYIGIELPDTELEHKDWVNSRSTWVRSINDEFVKRKNACRLHVIFGRGVQLLINGKMVNRHITGKTKKAVNCFNSIIHQGEDMLESNTEGKKLLRMFNISVRHTLTYWYGEVNLSGLPNSDKKAIMKIIKDNIPTEQTSLF